MAIKRTHRRYPLRVKAISVAVASCFSVSLESALANGTGAVVVSGNATFNRQGNQLLITNTPGAVINWQSFSIGSNEITRFIQQSAASSVLNRVVGVDPSIILGVLQSNGRVFLINPNGVLFGAGAQINVGGLVASTLNLSNADFAKGRLNFTDTPGAGSINNQGAITTPTGGQVYLIAPNVQNSGVITSPQGEVILAAGRTVEIVDAATPNLRIEITAPDTQAINVGQIVANSGKIGIYAGLIKNSGEIRADGVVVGANGEILLKASKNVTLDKGSAITASGPTAGKITIQSDSGTVSVAGKVEANATQGKGGAISIAGAQGVSVEPTGSVSANGTDGGSVLLASAAGSVTIAAPVTANATTGRAGQIAVNAATQAVLSVGGRLSASGGLGAGTVNVQGVGGVTLDTASSVQANGAAGGTVILQADQGAVLSQGLIEVSGTDLAGGNVNVAARYDITLDDTSRILANGRSGGEMRMESSEGTLTASGLINGLGSNGPGGMVLLLAPRVALVRRAFIDVSGDTGGGVVLVGGDYQGKNPDVQNASRTYVGPDSVIRADAITSGDGGKVIVWSNDGTQSYGTISARGGAVAGNGGFVEVSSKGWLDFAGLVDTSAPFGSSGTLLLDPSDVTISNSADSFLGGSFAAGVFANASGIANIQWATIDTQLASSNVVITTSGSGGSGNITVTALHSYSSANSLSLLAHNQIIINGSVTNTSAGDINMYAGWDGVSTSAPVVVAGATHDLVINRGISTQGAMTLKAGDEINVIAGTNNVTVDTAGLQTINAGGTLLIQGGADVRARLRSSGGQVITANNISLIAGTGSAATGAAEIQQTGGGSSQVITITGSNLTLSGGLSGASNFARIQNQGTTQVISFAVPGGQITAAGGTGTHDDFARIQALTGTQTISGAPNVTLTGGATGGLDDSGNFANIVANVGTQTIVAGNVTLLAGAAGINNFATIDGPAQFITVGGNLVLTGGGSITNAGALSGGGARIGGLGGGDTHRDQLATDCQR